MGAPGPIALAFGSRTGSNARRTSGTTRSRGKASASGCDPKAVRAWAASNRVELPARGRIAAGAAAHREALRRAHPRPRPVSGSLARMSDDGQPGETVKALFRHERRGPHDFGFVQVRQLTDEEWDAVIAAHGEVHQVVQSFDRFLSFAWQDLQAARRDAIDRAIPERDGSIGSLLEYRVLGYSTALWLYEEYVIAEVNRRKDEDLKEAVRALFSDTYDSSQAYRLVYSLRNGLQHGVRNLIAFRGTHRLVNGQGPETETKLHGKIVKESFIASKANATVRNEVREMEGDPEFLALCDEAYAAVQRLHVDLTPLLHPHAPAAARLLIDYMREIGNERAHFHEYPVGVPTKPQITTLGREEFEWVVRDTGYGPSHDDGRRQP